MALFPVCRRDLPVATSQAVIGEGVSTTGVGVDVDSGAGVSVGDAVGVGMFVPVAG